MAITSYVPIVGITKVATAKPKVHLLRKLSRKHLKKAWFIKHPTGYVIPTERMRIDAAFNKLTKREIAMLIVYT